MKTICIVIVTFMTTLGSTVIAATANQVDCLLKANMNIDQWTLSHNALRVEIRNMVGALDTFIGRLNNDNSDDQIPGWAVDTIKEWWKSHVAHATDHCKSEEKTYKPIFGERFIWPTEIDTLHDELDSVKDEVQTIMDKINKEKVSLTAVRDALAGYEETMLKHFEVEEMKVLPLMRAHFTAEELSITNRKVLEDASENAMGALIYAMSPDGNKFRSEFMKSRGIPSFVWYLAFKPRLNHYTKDVVAKVEALRVGKGLL